MTSLRPRAVALALFACLFLVNIPNVFATHYRYGTVYWTKTAETATTITVQVTYEVAMRMSFFGTPAIGSSIGLGTITVVGTGLSTSLSFSPIVTSTQPTQDILFASQTSTITLNKTALPVTFAWTSNARLSTLLEGNNDIAWLLQAVVPNDPSITRSPKSSSLPMVTVVQNTLNTVTLPTLAFDNLVNNLRFSTAAESLLTKTVPTGMSLSTTQPSTVLFTPSLLGLYAVQFMIESKDANGVTHAAVPLDMLFSSVAPPANSPVVTLSVPQTTYTATVGVPFTYTVVQTTTNPAGYTSQILNTPLPTGATISNPVCASGSSTCTSVFNWTPSLSSSGAVVCYQGSATSTSTGLTFNSQNQLCVTVNIGALATTTTAFPASGVASGPVTFSARLNRTVDNAPLQSRTLTFTWQDTGEVLGSALTDATGLATISPTVVLPTTGRTYIATFSGVTNQFLQSSAASNAVVNTGAAGVINAAPTVTPSPLPIVGDPLTVSAILNRVYTDGGLYGVGQTLTFTLTDPSNTQSVLNGGPTNATGQASVTFPGQIVAGTYSAKAFFPGSVSLSGPSTSPVKTFTVYQKTQLAAAPTTGIAGSPTTVSATLTALGGAPLSGRTVTFSAPGTSTVTAVTNAAGVATANLVFPTSGNITYTATYAPLGADLNRLGQAAIETATATATISAIQPTVLVFPAVNGVAGGLVSLTSSLTSNGSPLAGQTVDFSVNGIMVGSAVTNSLGVATLPYTLSTAGSFTAQADFAGTTGYAASTASSSVNASLATTSLTLNGVGTGYVADTQTYTANLTRTSAPAGPVSGATLAFTLTPTVPGPITTLTAATDANGAAFVSIPLSARGAFTVSVSYAGSNTLAAASASTSLAVYQKVSIATVPASGLAGAPITVGAQLVAVPLGPPITGQTITFDFSGVAPASSATTNAAGSASATTTFALPGNYPFVVSFSNVAGYFADANGVPASSLASASVTVTVATTSLVITPAPTSLVGSPLALKAQLSRVSAPAGGVSSAPVSFTVTLPDGSTTSVTATSDSTGAVNASLIATQRGVYTYSASFAGNGGLAPSTAAPASTTVYQGTNLTIANANGSATKPITISATLTNMPANTPLAGQSVTFDFSGPGSPASMVTTTDANGVASVIATFPVVATYGVTATFSNAAAFYTNSGLPVASTTATGSVSVTNNAPTFTPPADMVFEATSAAGAPVIFAPMGNDTEDGPIAAVCTPAAGTFAIGTTPVNCTVTDSIGAFVTGSFSVTVQDTTKPTLTLPTVPPAAATSVNGSVVEYTASATDIVDGSVPTSCVPASGSVFAIGITTVTCTATDAHGNTAIGTFTIEVTNNAPTFAAPGNMVYEATGATGASVSFAPMGNDTEDGPIAAVCTPAAGTFAIGTTPVNCTVTDVAGAFATGSFTVTVQDTTAPALTLPTVAPTAATGANGSVVNYTVTTATDIVDGTVPMTCAPASGSVFAIGITPVTCTATDAHGNTSHDSFNVEVTNNAPTFTAPANMVYEATSASGASVSFAPMGNDTEDGPIAAVCTPAAGTFAIGTTTVNCKVTDVTGAFATGSFTVTVQDTTKPTLTLPTLTPAYATSATGRIVTYSATASDIVDGALTPSCTPVSGGTFAIGTTTVTCTVTDAHGNTVNGSFSVEVLNNAPTVTVPADITADATARTGVLVNFTASGNDVEDGARAAVCTPASGSTFPIGTTTVTCTVTDTLGATAQATFTVTVNDITTPGEMHGNGFIRDDYARYQFDFRAIEKAVGNERATIAIRIDENGKKKGPKKRDDRFYSRTVDFIAFSDDPTIRPGRPALPQIDTVTIQGVGEWNGQANYRYEVFAQDGGEGKGHHEMVRVKIYSPTGALVATFEGDIEGGNIQSIRIHP